MAAKDKRETEEGTRSSEELLSFIQIRQNGSRLDVKIVLNVFKERLENQSRIFRLLKQRKRARNPSFKFAHVKEGDAHAGARAP